DAVLLVHVLEHIEDPVQLLRDLHRTSECLLVEVPDFDSDALNQARLALGLEFSSDADHVREYTEASIRELLGDTGWQVQVVRKRGGGIAVIARGGATMQA
ncbi:MAG: class I SAM-dependent methyltransferase, partial [Actinobacteria bacterium]|nr:class I SAM-dependent methyltransferase [Actinomycetota bacterium]